MKTVVERQRVIDMALALPGTTSDMPFEEDFDSTVLRHAATGKWFGLVMKAPCRKVGLDREGRTDVLNLKCDPLVSYGLFLQYPDIVPAYHMNKQLWITVRLEGSVPEETLALLIRMSYDLTARRPPRKGERSAADMY